MAKTTDALKILKSLHQDDPEIRELVEGASLNAKVAQMIYAARTGAGLTRGHAEIRVKKCK